MRGAPTPLGHGNASRPSASWVASSISLRHLSYPAPSQEPHLSSVPYHHSVRSVADGVVPISHPYSRLCPAFLPRIQNWHGPLNRPPRRALNPLPVSGRMAPPHQR